MGRLFLFHCQCVGISCLFLVLHNYCSPCFHWFWIFTALSGQELNYYLNPLGYCFMRIWWHCNEEFNLWAVLTLPYLRNLYCNFFSNFFPPMFFTPYPAWTLTHFSLTQDHIRIKNSIRRIKIVPHQHSKLRWETWLKN